MNVIIGVDHYMGVSNWQVTWKIIASLSEDVDIQSYAYDDLQNVDYLEMTRIFCIHNEENEEDLQMFL